MEPTKPEELEQLSVGDALTGRDTRQWTVVAMLEKDVFVVRYETQPSEPNWSGAEGYLVVERRTHNGILELQEVVDGDSLL